MLLKGFRQRHAMQRDAFRHCGQSHIEFQDLLHLNSSALVPGVSPHCLLHFVSPVQHNLKKLLRSNY